MKDKIKVKVENPEDFYDRLDALLGEDTVSMLNGHMEDNKGFINKAWFSLLVCKANTLYEGFFQTKEFANALFEFLTRDPYKTTYVKIDVLLDNFGMELESGADLASVFDCVGLKHSSQEDSALLPIAIKEFKGGVFHASNGIWLCFWKDLSDVRYV